VADAGAFFVALTPMHADLERAMALQRLDSSARDAQRRIAEVPERERALEARLEEARRLVAASRERLVVNQAARRAIEKDVAIVQSRLSKFRDQLMAVKTNREYQTMQKEIEVAQAEVRSMEEKILERMLEADDLTAAVKRLEAALLSDEKAVDADTRALASEVADLTALVDRIAVERAALVRALDPQVLALFETVSQRRSGIGVAEARDGICTICHVRLRPQVFNTVRRNEEIVQCDTCQRLLYFVPAAAPDLAEQAAP
jgi:predicted  nucleic acid-binding Zn-ribbon protein